jgi:hypothetical protein
MTLVAGPGGLLAMVNSAALNDVNGILLATAAYQLAANKRWMKAASRSITRRAPRWCSAR